MLVVNMPNYFPLATHRYLLKFKNIIFSNKKLKYLDSNFKEF